MHKILTFIQSRYPKFYLVYIKPVVSKSKYQQEALAFKGKFIPATDSPTILFFTAHKCASVLAERVLRRIAGSSSYKLLDFDNYFQDCKPRLKGIFENPRFFQRSFPQTGAILGPFRAINQSIHFDHAKRIINLRDPRDVLVSDYYSKAYSHELNLHILEQRKAALEQDIDAFVLSNLPRVRKVYDDYADIYSKKKNDILLLSYEEMVNDFASWVERLQNWCGLPQIIKNIEDVSRTENFRGRNVKTAHKRRVTPGEHSSALRTETIDVINRELRDTLLGLNYTI